MHAASDLVFPLIIASIFGVLGAGVEHGIKEDDKQ